MDDPHHFLAVPDTDLAVFFYVEETRDPAIHVTKLFLTSFN
jgi:hypothetical protein